MAKLLVICGPTATGKTELGIKLAQKFKGEIVSADSRQVYKGMDIGTGKDLPTNSKLKIQNAKLQLKIKNYEIGYRLLENIPIWLIDVCRSDQEFSAAHFVKYAIRVIGDIRERGKLPIVIGGTGFWIKALIDGVSSIGIPPDWRLRQKLSNETIKQLNNKLKSLNYSRWQRMNQSDRNNSRRLIRAIEIIKNQKSQPKAGLDQRPMGRGPRPLAEKLKIDELLMIGLKTKDYLSLYQRIDKRVEKRVKEGIEREIESLLNKGYSWTLPSFSATGYRVWQDCFGGKKSLEETIQRWQYDEHGLARRQLTYFRAMERIFARKEDTTAFRPGEIHFKKDKRIKWFDIDKPVYQQQIEKLVGEWYSGD